MPEPTWDQRAEDLEAAAGDATRKEQAPIELPIYLERQLQRIIAGMILGETVRFIKWLRHKYPTYLATPQEIPPAAINRYLTEMYGDGKNVHGPLYPPEERTRERD